MSGAVATLLHDGIMVPSEGKVSSFKSEKKKMTHLFTPLQMIILKR